MVVDDAAVAVVVAGQDDDHMIRENIEPGTMRGPAGVVAVARWGSQWLFVQGQVAVGAVGTGSADQWRGWKGEGWRRWENEAR